jgi:hypothetical protein
VVSCTRDHSLNSVRVFVLLAIINVLLLLLFLLSLSFAEEAITFKADFVYAKFVTHYLKIVTSCKQYLLLNLEVCLWPAIWNFKCPAPWFVSYISVRQPFLPTARPTITVAPHGTPQFTLRKGGIKQYVATKISDPICKYLSYTD